MAELAARRVYQADMCMQHVKQHFDAKGNPAFGYVVRGSTTTGPGYLIHHIDIHAVGRMRAAYARVATMPEDDREEALRGVDRANDVCLAASLPRAKVDAFEVLPLHDSQPTRRFNLSSYRMGAD